MGMFLFQKKNMNKYHFYIWTLKVDWEKTSVTDGKVLIIPAHSKKDAERILTKFYPKYFTELFKIELQNE